MRTARGTSNSEDFDQPDASQADLDFLLFAYVSSNLFSWCGPLRRTDSLSRKTTRSQLFPLTPENGSTLKGKNLLPLELKF